MLVGDKTLMLLGATMIDLQTLAVCMIAVYQNPFAFREIMPQNITPELEESAIEGFKALGRMNDAEYPYTRWQKNYANLYEEAASKMC